MSQVNLWTSAEHALWYLAKADIAILNHFHNSCRGNPPWLPNPSERAGTLGTAPTYLHE
jgi:hypothetical protein